MIESIEQKLSKMTPARLVKIVLSALDTMDETEQIDFIAKHIDARTSLSRLGAGNPKAFLDEVEEFCLDCLNEEYYSDEDDIEEYFSNRDYTDYYDDDWDYDEYYENTEWAETFTRLFNLSAMYIRSGDISTGYEANARLLSCLKEMMSSDDYLGTNVPMEYIDVDWEEVFALHYSILFQHHTDIDRATELAFRCFVNFGNLCTEGFLSNVKDITTAERVILDGLKGSHDWTFQRRCFELLEQVYTRSGQEFDKASKAKSLIDCNVYFYLFVVEGLCEQTHWQAATETARVALEQISVPPSERYDMSSWSQQCVRQDIRAAIQTKLVDAYEMLMDFEQAFIVAKHMFREAPSFKLYKRARGLAEKGSTVPAFFEFVEGQLERQDTGYGWGNLMRDIYSYEGEIQKMLDMAQSRQIDRNYYDRKYIALSMIYRALNGTTYDATNLGKNLSEYLRSASGQNGIEDMINPCADAGQQAELLMHGASLLRGIIAFHIGAAKRTRYAKAAYYMCVMRDIYDYLKREGEFQDYFREVMAQNSRRPALRDEMRIV